MKDDTRSTRADEHVTRAATLAAALAYAARGWKVFPATPGEKKSEKAARFSNGERWGATNDPKVIKANWRRWPNANIGMPTGVENNFFVVDADTLEGGHKHDGIAALRALEVEYTPLPDTLMAMSPSGSLHWYFKHPGPGIKIKNSASEIAKGVDVQGDGGMVLAPPSIMAAGAYRWLNDHPIAVAPQWLLALVAVSANEAAPSGTDPEADENRVALACAIIPNDDLDWVDWNRLGMALWRATGGSEVGGYIFDAWSQKSGKYDQKRTAEKWHKYFSSRPTTIGAGTLFYIAEEARPGWDDDLETDDVAALITDFQEKMQTAGWVAPAADSAQQEQQDGKTDGQQQDAKDDQQQQDTDGITATPYDFPAEETLPRDDWFYGKHQLRGEVAGTVAKGGTGKSNLGIVEALEMASGKKLLHDTVREAIPLRVVLINLEDKRIRMAKRIAAVMRHYGLTKEDIGDRLILFAKGEIKIKIATLYRGQVKRNEKLIAALIKMMVKNKADVLSIDSFIRTHGINENDNSAIQDVVECFEDIAEGANCAIHLWHHSRKTGGEKATVEDARGASAFIDACRSARVLETMSRKERDDLLPIVPDLKDPGYYFRSFNGKRNFAPPADQSDWFQFVSVILNNAGTEFFDDEGDNVGVVTPWYYPQVNIPKLTEADINHVLVAIKVGGPWRADQRTTKEPWVGVAVAKALGLDLMDKRNKRAAAALIAKLLEAGRLRRVTRPDQHRQQREYIEVAADNTTAAPTAAQNV